MFASEDGPANVSIGYGSYAGLKLMDEMKDEAILG